jgi:hypothetical protein
MYETTVKHKFKSGDVVRFVGEQKNLFDNETMMVLDVIFCTVQSGIAYIVRIRSSRGTFTAPVNEFEIELVSEPPAK